MGFNLNLGSFSKAGAAGDASKPPTRRKFGTGIFLFLFLFGAIFLVVGLLAFTDAQVDESWTRIQGKVIDINRHRDSDGDTMYTPVYEYTVGNKSYEIKSNFSSSIRPTIGATHEIAYDPSEPSKAKVAPDGGSTAFILGFPSVGAIIILVDIIVFIRSRKRSKAIDELTKTGRKVTGMLTSMRSVGSVNNVPIYKLTVTAYDGVGNSKEYTSDTIDGGAWTVAVANFATNPIPIDIYLNNANPEKYYVDISDIPNLTPDKLNSVVSNAVGGQPVAQPQSVQPIAPAQPPQEESHLQSNLFGSDDTKI
jgi:hypothetical protein